ncbi:MAG: DUF2207 domain-containing protein [Clostridium perfringens]|nr:DUF2207 domain-containing protein [Clostridium perfringens]
MKRKLGKFLVYFLFNVFCIIGMSFETVFALDTGMTISKMDINVDVSEDRVFSVVEKINVSFLEDRHGIFRNIPLNKAVLSVNSVTDENGKKYDYTVESEGADKIIKIGDADKVVNGNTIYIISYDIAYKGSLDSLSYNIVGPEWDTTIDKVNFTINMPKAFNENNIKLFSGEAGESSNSLVSFNTDNNTIKGETINRLMPKEGITILLPLEKGYFKSPKVFNKFTLISVIISALAIALAIKSSVFYRKKKRFAKENGVKVIGFYPPRSFNPIDLSYIAYPSKNLTTEELTSIIFYYANKGLIEIHNINGEFELKRVKEVTKEDFQNRYEYDFFINLFNLSKNKDGIVKASDFEHGNMGFIESFISLSKSENMFKRNYIENLSSSFNLFLCIISIPLGVLSLSFYCYSVSYSVEFSIIYSIIIGALSLFIIFPLSLIFRKINYAVNILLTLGILGFLMYTSFNLGVVSDSLIGSIPLITVYIGIAFSFIISQEIPCIYIHTVEGAKVYGEVEGYKEFIKTAKIQELEMLIKENPNYYYDILPYAICLKITKVFQDKFKDLKYENPTWYYGNYPGDIFIYNEFSRGYISKISNGYKDYVREQQKERSDNFTGGGGGSVGGGSVGGGGGGSW